MHKNQNLNKLFQLTFPHKGESMKTLITEVLSNVVFTIELLLIKNRTAYQAVTRILDKTIELNPGSVDEVIYILLSDLEDLSSQRKTIKNFKEKLVSWSGGILKTEEGEFNG